ncbi:hypothetical protein BKA61DRAFT_14679 [Leptodontidium sp. MPI-SDFR-AT-0119]|nr:hypothetical protein BKA61DRAFT_14679 [Leptodontidium sp. MPI-SDFR-AT-0119]
MPSRSLSFHQPDGSSIGVTPRGHINPNTNDFDKVFDEELGQEEWDDWIKWEGATTELLPTLIERRKSVESRASSPDTWAMGLEMSGVCIMSASYAAGTEFPFVNAPFGLKDTPPTSASSISNKSVLPLYPTTALYPTLGQVQQLRRSYRRFSSLTEAEERSLQDIAMPYHVLSNFKIASAPASPDESHTLQLLSPPAEPEGRTHKNNKRKSFSLGEQSSSALYQSRKRGHNAIEKRYRTNLKAKIESLREGVPSLCGPNNNVGEEYSNGQGDGKSSQQKYGKADILMKALEYIQYLEKTTQRLAGGVDTLKTRVGAFERLALRGSIILNSNRMEGNEQTGIDEEQNP